MNYNGFNRGDWVRHDDGSGKVEYGRVAKDDYKKTYVCFLEGECSARDCNPEYLSIAEPGTFNPNPLIGFHRFDDSCPDYDPTLCSTLCPDKGIR